MSDLVTRLNDDLKSAMKARDEFRVGVLRMVIAKVKDLHIVAGRDKPLADAQVVGVLASYAKQRADAADSFAQAGRADLRDKEMRERDVVMSYLPKQPDEQGIRAPEREIIAATGATSSRDLGKVMGPAMGRLKGQADGGRVQAIVKELLGG